MSSCHSPPDTIRLRSRLALDQIRSSPTFDAPQQPASLDEALQTIDGANDVHWLDIVFQASPPGPISRAAVRIFDVAVAGVSLMLLTPVMIAVAVAVKLDSSGPLVYGSPRVGHDKPMFRAWKFRSMRPDADERLAEVLENDPDARREYQVFHKLKDDPRLTRVGAFIRRTSLDELPQLFNILAGEMSVVGPRPKLLSEREAFGPALPVVLQVKPGLTGMWQVSGRNRLPVQDRVILDLEYARNRTLRGDIRICAKTFVQLWRPGKHGAY